MVTKDALSDQLNEKLDLEIDWSQLNKEDLELLIELVDSGALIEPMIKLQVKEHGKEAWESQVEDWYPGKYASRVI